MGSEWIYLGFVLLVQLGGIIYWASNVGARVKQTEKDVDKISQEFDALTKLEIRLSIVETILDNQTSVLREIRDEIRESNKNKLGVIV